MVEKLVTPYIDSQFPAYYRENYPKFVDFVRMYYGWLQQQGQAIGEARRLDEYRDVDLTKEEYLIYFKNKFLPFLKFVTETDKRTIIKHVLDLYRTKGTERGIDLFFKLVYGQPAAVYYPSTDLFRLSDNRWIKKNYLEMAYSGSLRQFVGKRVIGTRSQATAFVEQFVVKKVGPKYSYLLYISNVVGDFQTNESVKYDGLDTESYPRIIGSLSSLTITEAGEEFAVGDLVNLYSNSGGSGGIARVAEIFAASGLVDFQLVDGGWGYSSNSSVYISEKNISIANVIPDSALNNSSSIGYNGTPYFTLETVYQPMARLDCEIDSNTVAIEFATIPEYTVLSSYDGANSVTSTVEILSVNVANSTAGNLVVYIASGNAQLNTYFWSPGNTYSVNVSVYADQSATGNLVGSSSNLTIYVSNSTAQFSKGQSLYQLDYVNGDSNAPYVSATANIYSAVWGGTTGTIVLNNANGIFRPTVNVHMTYANGVDSGKTAYLKSYDSMVGVANITNGFTVLGNTYIYFSSSNTVAKPTLISGGQGATFTVGAANTLGYPEAVSIYTDMLSDNNDVSVPYMSLALNAVSWDFPKSPSGNVSSVIDDLLSSYTGNIGSITILTNVNPGEDYDSRPFVYIVDKHIAGYNKRDYVATIDDLTGNFITNELVTQAGGGKGLIKAANTTHLSIRRASFGIDLAVGSVLTGDVSGATANITSLTVDNVTPQIGADAVVSANVKTSSGSVASLEIIDSGYNFIDNEEVTFESQDKSRVGAARGSLIRQGVSKGTLYDESSFLSANKYLFDGYYYQEYSYDIQVSVTKDVFEQNFMQTMHMAGTKMFSTFVYSSVNSQRINAFLPEDTANTII